MDWKDIKDTVAQYAPLAGTLIGGPAGAAVGAIISSALGVPSTPDDVSQALKTDPQAAVKLKEIESTRQVELQKLVVQSEANRLAAQTAEVQAATANTADARKMFVETRTIVPAALAFLITVGFFGILAMMLMGVWKANDNNALLILLGSLGTSWGAAVNFYFGSSAGSSRKDELLARSMPADPRS